MCARLVSSSPRNHVYFNTRSLFEVIESLPCESCCVRRRQREEGRQCPKLLPRKSGNIFAKELSAFFSPSNFENDGHRSGNVHRGETAPVAQVTRHTNVNRHCLLRQKKRNTHAMRQVQGRVIKSTTQNPPFARLLTHIHPSIFISLPRI